MTIVVVGRRYCCEMKEWGIKMDWGLKTILTRLVFPRACSGIETTQEWRRPVLTINSSETVTVIGISVKDCCLGLYGTLRLSL